MLHLILYSVLYYVYNCIHNSLFPFQNTFGISVSIMGCQYSLQLNNFMTKYKH